MTLLEAAQSLQLIELAAVSWINILSSDTHHIAQFTMALLLPFMDPALSVEFRGGLFRFWPDRTRLLDSPFSIRQQIQDLHESGVLGDLAFAYRRTAGLWIVKTHAGYELERRIWLSDVIAMEGRSPVV
jgi:hypothetical protein